MPSTKVGKHLNSAAFSVMAAARLRAGTGIRGQAAPVRARYQWVKMRLASHALSDAQRKAYEHQMKQALTELDTLHTITKVESASEIDAVGALQEGERRQRSHGYVYLGKG